MTEEMSIAKSHVKYVFYMADYDIMSEAKLYQTRSAKARMRTLVYDKTHRRNKSETQAQLQLIKTSGFFNPGFYMYRISFFHSMPDKAGNIP